MIRTHEMPCVLVIAGHDPSGGAGIQADIETLVSFGCYPTTAVTALTVQNTASFSRCVATDPALLEQQLEAVMTDFSIAACKVGLLPSVDHVAVTRRALEQLKGIPIVLDPVLAAGVGTQLADLSTIEALREQLLPLATITTPNINEARQLVAGTTELAQIATRMHELQWAHVLITGSHAATTKVTNRLFFRGDCIQEIHWQRLSGQYHGSGCTLASAICAGLAHGQDILSASEQAQRYTWTVLKHAMRLGRGQALPKRSAQ